MLQQFGASYFALFVDVADEEHGDVGFFGEAQELGGALAHLGDAAGGGVEVRGAHRLDRVDNEQVGLQFLCLAEQFGRIGFGKYKAIGSTLANAVGAHFDLFFAFFAADVQDFSGQLQGHLEHEGAFADARLAADEHQRARHDAPSEYPVEFFIGGAHALGVAGLDLGQGRGFGAVAAFARRCPGSAFFFTCCFFLDDFFLVGVPLVAMGAFADPFGGGSAAGSAKKYGSGFGHRFFETKVCMLP